MKKVCHMTSVHQRCDIRIFKKECVSLARAGYDVTLLCVDNLGDEERDGVKIKHVASPEGSTIKRVLTSSKILLAPALELDADIYHFHDPELLPLGKKLKKKGKIVIFDSHEDFGDGYIAEKDWIPKVLRKLISILYGKYERNTLKKFDALISVTPHIVNRLEKINSNTAMITNYPILERVTHENYPHEQLKICFAGGVRKEWSHKEIIQAISRFKGKIKYVFVGSADDGYLEDLKATEGYEYCEYLGVIPHAMVAELYKTASVGMALNKYSSNVDGKNGTLGNTKLFEIMMAGLPVICTDFKLWSDIVHNEQGDAGIMINPNNIDEIEQAIRVFLDKPSLMKEMGENGRELVAEKYNWDIEEQKLLKLYKNL